MTDNLMELEEGRTPTRPDKKPRKRKKRKKKNYLLRFLILLAVAGGLYYFSTTPFFDVTAVQVKNNSYYTGEQIIEMAGAKVGGKDPDPAR